MAYTFAGTGTQVFIGNSLEDYISFDFATRAGVRQDVGHAGIVGISYLKTSVAAEVWEDPFSVNSNRQGTERDSNGYRLIWDNVFGSGVELTYSSREVEIENEQSGSSLNLSTAERSLLDRNGDNRRLSAKYTFSDTSQRHVVSPELVYTKQDRNGEAVSNAELAFNLNYVYTVNRWSYVMNTNVSKTKFDEVNPMFNQEADSTRYGASVTAFYKEPFNLDYWYLNTGVLWVEEDSDIDFYDSSIKQISAGMLYRF